MGGSSGGGIFHSNKTPPPSSRSQASHPHHVEETDIGLEQEHRPCNERAERPPSAAPIPRRPSITFFGEGRGGGGGWVGGPWVHCTVQKLRWVAAHHPLPPPCHVTLSIILFNLARYTTTYYRELIKVSPANGRRETYIKFVCKNCHDQESYEVFVLLVPT